MNMESFGTIDINPEEHKFEKFDVRLAESAKTSLDIINVNLEMVDGDAEAVTNIFDDYIPAFINNYNKAIKKGEVLDPTKVPMIMPVPVFNEGDLLRFKETTLRLQEELDEYNRKFNLPKYLEYSRGLENILSEVEINIKQLKKDSDGNGDSTRIAA